MATRRENIKALFENTRSRVIIIFTIILLLLTVGIGLYKLSGVGSGATGVSNLSDAPASIESIPGALDQTAEYAKLQEMQNVSQAQVAEKTGGSAIPTIIRSQTIGNGVQPIGTQEGVGFSTLSLEQQGGTQRSLWIQTLKDSSCSKDSMSQILGEGAKIVDLKEACSCLELKDNGFKLNELQQVCSCPDLKGIGFNALDFKRVGYDAGRLRACGFDACTLKGAGFNVQEMKDGGYSDGELQGAGFTNSQIAAASGIPDGLSAQDVRNAGCDPQALAKLRQAGVTASAIRNINGCSLQQLKSAGFSPKDLRNAGFSAAELKNAGFSPTDLRNAGYNARDLLNAGFTPDDLKKAGFGDDDIKAAEAQLPPGITARDIQNAGCDETVLKMERLAGVSATAIRQNAGCSLAALKNAGFTDKDLSNAGFSPDDIAKAAKAISDTEIKQAGCDPAKLQALKLRGVSAERIHALNGCTADQLKLGGFSPAQVNNATLEDAIKAAGCDPTKLHALLLQGISADKIRQVNGCNSAALKAAGYDVKGLTDAGFSPKELLAAGFTPDDLSKAGINPASIIAAGRTDNCNVDSLKAARAAGVTAATIRQTLGCSADALKAAGYGAQELKDAGFTAGELKAAGFSPEALKAAGFSAKALKDAGFTAAQLKAAGFNANQLKDAGFDAKALKDAGFNAADLKKAGFLAGDLKDAGFSAGDLKNAGFSAADLNKASFTSAALKDAGFTQAELKDAGVVLAPITVTTPSGMPSDNGGIPALANPNAAAAIQATQSQQLEKILQKQNQRLNDQRYQQRIQQRAGEMLGSANQFLALWKAVPAQSYVGGENKDDAKQGAGSLIQGTGNEFVSVNEANQQNVETANIIKTGDILFAVLDTSVNTDEPGPILATIVSGKLRGARLIGSFTLPPNAQKMVVSFNTLSAPGATKTTSISAFAIDPNTARTALASRVDNHYLLRYGGLFASSFMQGFGNALQAQGTQVTIGGTGGGNNINVQQGINQSTLDNAIIALATVGKTWGQFAQQQFNRQPTIELFSGTSMGILFTQDVRQL